MTNINITHFMGELCTMLNYVIFHNESPISSNLREKLLEGMRTPISECIPENEVIW